MPRALSERVDRRAEALTCSTVARPAAAPRVNVAKLVARPEELAHARLHGTTLKLDEPEGTSPRFVEACVNG
jgi:hypothetical protein